MIVYMYIQMVFVLYSIMWPRPHTEATAQYVSTTKDHSVLDCHQCIVSDQLLSHC